MAHFFVLLRTMLRHYFSLSVLREQYVRKKQDLWKPVLMALALIVGLGPMLYGYVRLLGTLYSVSTQLQQPGFVVLFGLVTVQVVVLLFGLFYLMSVFYFSTDLELLVPLPLEPQTILAAKFSIVLICEYLTVLPIAVPPIIIYGLQQGVGFFYWLKALAVIALLPCLPLALASILVVLIMRFTNLARNRDAMRVAAGIVSVALVLVLQWNLSKIDAGEDPMAMITQLITNPNSLLNLVGKRFPPSLWGAHGLISQGSKAAGYLGAYMGSTLIALVLLGIVARRHFYAGLLEGSSHVHRRQHKVRSHTSALRSRSPMTALIQREWQLLTRNPIFAMTAGMNLLLPPIILALPILGAGEQLIDIQAASKSPHFLLAGSLGIAAMFAALGPISCIPSTAISREGRLFWISRTIPVKPARQLLAKLIFSVLVTLAGSLLVVLIVGPLLGLPPSIVWRGTGLGVLALVGSSALGLTVDALWPRLEWDDPQKAMKGNVTVMVSLVIVGALGYGLARLAMWWVGLGWSEAAVLQAMALTLAVVAMLSVRLLMRIGPTVYTPYGFQVQGRLPRAKTIGAVIGIVFVVVIGLFVAKELLTAVNLDYSFEAEQVSFASVRLPYDEITTVEYLESIPPLSQRVGTSVGNYKTGTFNVAGIGRGKVFATDVTKPALLLRTESEFYIITPDDAREHYEQLQRELHQ